MTEAEAAVPTASSNPFREPGLPAHQAPVGALVQVEQQRAVAEVQARMMIARANPRKAIEAMDAILSDCERPTVAEHAVYQYARGGTDIQGPSIKLAETIARRWGNLASGIKEMGRAGGFSECIAYAWDLETGYYDERQFQVRHWRDTKGGGYPLKDERDIYELIANMGQRRKRAVLLSVLPPDVVGAAVTQCEKTMRARADTSPEGMAKMVDAFSEYGVTRAQIEARIQRRLDAISPAQVVSLKKVYASLRDGMGAVSDFFEPDPAGQAAGATGADGQPASAAERVKERLRKRKEPAGATTPPPQGEASASGPAAGPDEPVKTSADDVTNTGPDAASLREQLMKATSRDDAMLVVDRARHLATADYDSLVDLLEQRFPEAE